MYSPFLKVWKPLLDQAMDNHLAEAQEPLANDASARSHPVFGKIFDVEVPDEIDGFSLDSEERKRMSIYWHAGEDAAHKVRITVL